MPSHHCLHRMHNRSSFKRRWIPVNPTCQLMLQHRHICHICSLTETHWKETNHTNQLSITDCDWSLNDWRSEEVQQENREVWVCCDYMWNLFFWKHVCVSVIFWGGQVKTQNSVLKNSWLWMKKGSRATRISQKYSQINVHKFWSALEHHLSNKSSINSFKNVHFVPYNFNLALSWEFYFPG